MSRAALLLILWLPAVVCAHGEQQWQKKFEQLEERVQRLEHQLNTTRPPSPATVDARYWLGEENPFTASEYQPLSEGRVTLGQEIDFLPQSYGINQAGILNTLQDPSRYPVAAISLSGQVAVSSTGLYRLEVQVTPPREVGGAGNVSVSVTLMLDGKVVYRRTPSDRLASEQITVALRPGTVPLNLKAVALSPGFGPSPVRTRMRVSLTPPGAIDPRPISRFIIND